MIVPTLFVIIVLTLAAIGLIIFGRARHQPFCRWEDEYRYQRCYSRITLVMMIVLFLALWRLYVNVG